MLGLLLYVAAFLAASTSEQVSGTSTAEPVKLTIFIESLCPDCQMLFKTQLGPAYALLSDIVDLEIVPYGNAQEEQNPNGTWKFTCQHGPRECAGNLVETCALRLVPEMKTVFPFILCLENSGAPDTHGPQCAEKHSIDYEPIQSCVNSDQGNQWQHENAVKTAQLQPPHEYVPWVLLNGVHTEDIEQRAESDLVKLICDTYMGPPPAACKDSWDYLQTNEQVDSSPSKVQVGVYYETLCGDSRRFIVDQLWNANRDIGSIMDVDLVPYGKARESQASNGTWLFDCHFGPNECKANLIQTCAINYFWEEDKDQVLSFIKCMERDSVPHMVAHTCASHAGLDYNSISQCTRSPEGNELQHQMAQKTQALDPPLNFVPWITINGVHDESQHDDYLDNFQQVVCRAYKGTPPAACL